jgi:hypothetical protein
MKEFKYVPILKWRPAEITALSNVRVEDKSKTLPVIELVMPSVDLFTKNPITKERTKKPDDKIRDEIINKFETRRVVEITDELEKSWGAHPLILDFTLLYGKDTNKLKIDGIKKIIPECFNRGLIVIPVVNLVDNDVVVDEIFDQVSKKNVEDICVRITIHDLLNIVELNKKLLDFITKRSIIESHVHLLIDLKYLGDNTNISYKTLFKAGQSIFNLNKWKTLIFASGSFPMDVSKYKVDDDVGSEPRLDWLLWSKEIEEKDLVRRPIFGDYTIRNPIHNDGLQFLQSSATLKYTSEKDWKIFRGQKGKNEQYLAHANLLVTQTAYFSGRDFSFGDKYIDDQSKYLQTYMNLVAKDKKKKGKGVGAAGNWIAAGISHHLALVLSQTSNQF